MKISVKAKSNAREEKIERMDETHFSISVKEPPVGGKANAAIRRVVAHHFGVPPSRVELVSGHASRQKVFEVLVE